MDTTTALEVSSPSSKYDVFLSFRGADTRKGFTDNLLCTLEDNRVNVFIDERKLERGESISDELREAIEHSRISVIVFSKNYADSRWCLDELVKIMECREKDGQIVLPIFYDVDPSDVRKQTGCFEPAFQRHGNRIEAQRWRAALTQVANLAGEVLADGFEGRFIRKIVDTINTKLKNRDLKVATHEIGIDSRVNDISTDLHGERSDDVRIIGILGMIGMGKTTVAKAIFNRFGREFEGKCFLSNVREGDMVKLQKQLLCDILKSTNIEVSSVSQGTKKIEKELGSIRVLIIIDDIDCREKLDQLAIKRGSFVRGSRIIITTRNEHLLKILEVDKICLAQTMNEEESLQLFSLRAFGTCYPNDEYLELSRKVVDYCGGLPLALEVLGSYLCTKSTSEWKNALDKLKRRPHGEIHKKLKICYDEISDDDELRDIFLDVCCFFIGMNKDYVMSIFDGCDFNPATGFKELHERCLATVDKEGNMMMHDLIRDMGREIVHAESPKKPGKRSRLWHHEDIKAVLRKKSGTEEIEGLILDLQESNKPSFSIDAFREMQRLRLLKLKGVKFTGHCEHLSKTLRWLCWHEFPLEVIGEEFNQPSLVDIDLSHSNIQVWEDSNMSLEKLKFLNLGYCNSLKRSPDFSKLPNLEKLILEACKSLSKIHHSLVQLKNLKYLSLADCNLTAGSIPEDLRGLSSLEVLSLSGNNFSCLPFLGVLSNLQTLQLKYCKNLKEIPDLPKNLEILEADECIALEKMPNFSEMSRMRELHLNHSPKLTEIPGLDKSLNSMSRIHMEGCTNLTAAFKEAIVQGWSASRNGDLFLPGNDFPSLFRLVEPKGEIVVPQSFGCDIKALTLGIIYSSDDSQSGDYLRIHVVIQHRGYDICAMKSAKISSDEDYLWLGHLSNNKLNVKGGDKITVSAYFRGPGCTDDIHLRVKKIGVNLEPEKPMKEYTSDCESMLYLSGYNEEAIIRQDQVADLSDENILISVLKSMQKKKLMEGKIA